MLYYLHDCNYVPLQSFFIVNKDDTIVLLRMTLTITSSFTLCNCYIVMATIECFIFKMGSG